MNRLPFKFSLIPAIPLWVAWPIPSNHPFLRSRQNMDEGVVSGSVNVGLGERPRHTGQHPMTSERVIIDIGAPSVVFAVELDIWSTVINGTAAMSTQMFCNIKEG